MEMMKARYPHVHNEGEAELEDGMLTFSYVDTNNAPRTDTLPVLTSEEIVSKVQARMDRFNQAPMGARESDFSRSERKHIAAHATHNEDVLKQAWAIMDEEQRMEFEMMLSSASHSGISSPAEVKKSKPTPGPVGDNGKPLEARKKQPRIIGPSESLKSLRSIAGEGY